MGKVWREPRRSLPIIVSGAECMFCAYGPGQMFGSSQGKTFENFYRWYPVYVHVYLFLIYLCKLPEEHGGGVRFIEQTLNLWWNICPWQCVQSVNWAARTQEENSDQELGLILWCNCYHTVITGVGKGRFCFVRKCTETSSSQRCSQKLKKRGGRFWARRLVVLCALRCQRSQSLWLHCPMGAEQRSKPWPTL